MSVSEKLKQARMAADLTQETVAEKVGVTRQTISNWENEKSYPDIGSVIILSDIYGMTLDGMLKGDHEMIEHLKDSTDVVKSNKKVILSFFLAGALCAALIVIRIVFQIPRISGFISNMIAVSVFFIGLITAVAGSINLEKLAKQKTSNKTLIKTGMILLYTVMYIPLVLVIPEAISLALHAETEWLKGVIRGSSAVMLLIPAFVLYRKLHYLFKEKE